MFTKRKCQRCGVKAKRRLINNPDGTLSCIGWDPLLEPGYEELPEPQIEPPTPAIQRISFGVLLKYFLHGTVYSVLGFVMFFVWAAILLFLVSVGHILGLVIGLGVFFFLMGGMNAIITFMLWFPVKMSFWNVFFHGLALCIALVIVNGIFITIPNLVFPGDPTVVATLILGALLDGIVG
ncbi:MAG: hypothetical protein GWN17_10495, partial [Candidatus Korarchaeota archaeon]|nr:hypothetical protein [Candidatus Thorarchaeota archaeon]NIW52630.1 hypothetical protein [Candidatus Korarchaeota archaeon]